MPPAPSPSWRAVGGARYQASMADENDVENAARILKSGGIVAMPTETVYGLAGDATNDRAVARIFEAKGRPRFNPLIVHIGVVAEAATHADFSPLAERLAASFWPGPLTIVAPRRATSRLSLLASAGLDTVALRSPRHPTARALLAAFGGPLAAPSANASGEVSPTTAAHVAESLGRRVDLILDGGPCAVGVESTIVKIADNDATLLRPGGLAVADIERVAGIALRRAGSAAVEAPGMLASHYAPRAPIRLEARDSQADEVFLAFGPPPPGAGAVLQLSLGRNLVEAAARLFAHLRAADALVAARGLRGIAVAPVPEQGLGEAINDRLRRAAAPKG
ncbi:MAG: threonylcarbamoyl-AMP synthase [Parvularculaceae bacterium]|nr:threonylcarbamoyl-AMP synthase [Parvularculaceae bacterium]